jgi:hypothetical protein
MPGLPGMARWSGVRSVRVCDIVPVSLSVVLNRGQGTRKAHTLTRAMV